MKKLKSNISNVKIPISKNQDNASVEILLWNKNGEVASYDIIFHTANSTKTIVVSHKELKLLFDKIKEVNL